jgi:ligand-binding SRPBCC domain-containing protein
MADHVLETSFWLPRPRPEVFAFFADPHHLERVSPANARLRWLVPPPALGVGAVLDFRVSILGFRTRWRVVVREWDAPYRFVDAQVLGPFSRWEHRHRFLEGPEDDRPAARAGTWVEDRVTYRLPGGALGSTLHALGAERRILAAFAHRERRLRVLLG